MAKRCLDLRDINLGPLLTEVLNQHIPNCLSPHVVVLQAPGVHRNLLNEGEEPAFRQRLANEAVHSRLKARKLGQVPSSQLGVVPSTLSLQKFSISIKNSSK